MPSPTCFGFLWSGFRLGYLVPLTGSQYFSAVHIFVQCSMAGCYCHKPPEKRTEKHQGNKNILLCVRDNICIH